VTKRSNSREKAQKAQKKEGAGIVLGSSELRVGKAALSGQQANI
jgi:hypothetical protein